MMKQALLNFLFFFSFFPFTKLIPVIEAEVQPISGILAFIFILLYGIKRNALNYISSFLIFIIFFYSLLSIAYGVNSLSVILQVIAYTSSILIFIVLKDYLKLLSKKVLIVSFTLYVVTGILQELNLFGYVIHLLRLDLIIPRIGAGVFGGSRGVTFLSPEPSHSARIIFQMLATIFLFRTNWLVFRIKKWKISKVEFYIYLILGIFMLLINRSGTGLLMIFIFTSAYFISKLGRIIRKPKTKYLIWLATASVTVIISTVLLIELAENYSGKIRFLGLISLVTNPEFWDLEFPRLLALVGGKRFLTVLIGYKSLFSNFALGHGVASYKINFLRLAEFAGIDLSSIPTLPESVRNAEALKPDSYASSLAMDTGILGVILVILILIYCYFTSKTITNSPEYVRHYRFAIYAVASFMVLFYSSSAFPVAWVLLAYVHSGFPCTTFEPVQKKECQS